MSAHFVVIGVGSNQRPVTSIGAAIDALLAESGALWLSRFDETAPVGMTDDSGPFLNGALGLVTRLDPAALKGRLVELERRAGRRRDDPERHTRARPLDLDIEVWFDLGDLPPAQRPDAPYVAPFVDDVLALFAGEPPGDARAGRPIHLSDGRVVGRRPTLIRKCS